MLGPPPLFHAPGATRSIETHETIHHGNSMLHPPRASSSFRRIEGPRPGSREAGGGRRGTHFLRLRGGDIVAIFSNIKGVVAGTFL